MPDTASLARRTTLPDDFRDRQREWLDGLGVLNRPWLILGSAPSPILPEALLRSHARVDINNAGRTAQQLGLGDADLTFRKKTKPWSEHPTLRTRGLIWYHTAPVMLLYLRLLLLPRVHVNTIMRIKRAERDTIVRAVAGISPRGVGDRGKVTNGVAALCYGLFVGVPEIVLAGFSLSKDGHSYNDVNRPRRQVEEDTLVLSQLRDRSEILTTEPSVAETIGIRLWTGA
ncbi:hypothetical protein ACG873_08720 [Mesorhizobium sp. AaZ16]|jgi:hypothetical protein|uniref:hypothetical protein n=1 Tax=Mesorhizobium sp. AaZ16 TaxID=3402289 RepID=UPI00374F67CB